MSPHCPEIVPALLGWRLVNRNKSMSTETLAVPDGVSAVSAFATAGVAQLQLPLLADRSMPWGFATRLALSLPADEGRQL
jgi:hypothetical protein